MKPEEILIDLDRLFLDHLRLKAEVITLREVLVSHIEKTEKVQGNPFDGDVYRKKLDEISNHVVQELLVQYPKITEYLSKLINDGLKSDNETKEGQS